MLNIQSKLKKDEKITLRLLLEELKDDYRDFYITKDRLRLYIKDNVDLLFECLDKGDKILFKEDQGIIFLYGWSDGAKRKYLKILTKNTKYANDFLKVVDWNVKEELWAKIKKNSPYRNILLDNGFIIICGRGKELLLKKEAK